MRHGHTATHDYIPSHTVTYRHIPSRTVIYRHVPLHTVTYRYSCTIDEMAERFAHELSSFIDANADQLQVSPSRCVEGCMAGYAPPH